MQKIISKFIVALAAVSAVSCTLMDENVLDEGYVSTHPENAEGLLLHAYAGFNAQNCWSNNMTAYYLSVASDEAVSNKAGAPYRKMVTGELSPSFNPVGTERWDKSYNGVFYINKFLDMVDIVPWYPENENIHNLFIRRLSGEAYALRALLHQQVAECFSGRGSDGKLYAVPFYDKFLEEAADFKAYQRMPYELFVDKLMKEYDKAYDLLPYIYSDDEKDIADKDAHFDKNAYRFVCGSRYKLRLNGEIVRALQARLMLTAGSRAFGDNVEYDKRAAQCCVEVLSKRGWVLPRDGVVFYDSEINDLNNDEFLWRMSKLLQSAEPEKANFAPSLNGRGTINPSNNFVRAFPMSDGYPAGMSPKLAYDEKHPYVNRDPRLDAFVVRHGMNLDGRVIDITPGSVNGVMNVPEQSTRTGYYLKKLLYHNITIPVSGAPTGKSHIAPLVRCTELFLILAEAQNNIGGPNFKAEGSQLSARDIMRMIRKRGLGLVADGYLDSITTREKMMALIQNERRIELSFEGFRFWDMRRWGLPLDETITGCAITEKGDYSEFVVEERPMTDSKYNYMPLRRADVLKYDYIQNQGW